MAAALVRLEQVLVVLLVVLVQMAVGAEVVLKAWLSRVVMEVLAVKILFGPDPFPVLVFLLVLLVPALPGEEQVGLPGLAMVVLVAPVVVMVVVAVLEGLQQAQELRERVVMALTVFLFLHTHRQVEHRNGSPTLIRNIQLQYPPTSKLRLLPPPLALRLSPSTLRKSTPR